MLCLTEIIKENEYRVQEENEKIRNCKKLSQIVLAVLNLARFISCKIIEKELEFRNKEKCNWSRCQQCKEKLESKGSVKRTFFTLVGKIQFKRKMGRCPHCKKGYLSLLDKSLGLTSHQKASNELRQIVCLLCVFVPFETCSRILTTVTGLSIPIKTVYNWCQYFGSIAYNCYLWELKCFEMGFLGAQEEISEEILSLPLVIGGDGVMVPMRPFGGSPKGAVSWKEVKVGVFARIKKITNNKGQKISKLINRRLVAELGNIELFQKYMELESHKQKAK